MREIKFRAWSPTLQKMLTPEECDVWPIRVMEEAGDILMQYTGLKDRNGKGIYEGDIVACVLRSNGKPAPSQTMIIKWRSDEMIQGWNIRSNRSASYEVIGNIYSNPELLTNG